MLRQQSPLCVKRDEGVACCNHGYIINCASTWLSQANLAHSGTGMEDISYCIIMRCIHCVAVFSYLSRPHSVSREEREREEGRGREGQCNSVPLYLQHHYYRPITSVSRNFDVARRAFPRRPLLKSRSSAGWGLQYDLATEITVCIKYSHVGELRGWRVRGLGGWGLGSWGVGGLECNLASYWPAHCQAHVCNSKIIAVSFRSHTHSACVHQTSQASATSDNVKWWWLWLCWADDKFETTAHTTCALIINPTYA